MTTCEYPQGDCEISADGFHESQPGSAGCVYCLTPGPEGFDAWRTIGGECDHDYCIDAAAYGAQYRDRLTRDERDAIEADTALMRDEFHGRDTEGALR